MVVYESSPNKLYICKRHDD